MAKRKTPSLELISLCRDSYASHSASEKLLAHVRKHGLPESSSRTAQFKARKDVCRGQRTEYGCHIVDLPVPLTNGLTKTMPFQNPLAFFNYNCKHSADYASVVAKAWDKQPSTPAKPWKIIIYQDGVDPSDGLSKNHSRKCCVFYWSFAEFGMYALGHEEVWGTLCVCRDSEHRQLAGGINTLFGKVLSLFFGDVHDIRRAGVAADLPDGRHIVVIAEAGVLLADMPAIKECISCKGHSGTVCCCLCINCVQQNAPGEAIPMHLLSDNAVSISEFDIKAFKPHSKQSVRRVVEKLNAKYVELKDPANKNMNTVTFSQHSQLLGWSWTFENVILNARFDLDVPNMIMYDWAHLYVHEGLGDVEFGMCMKVFHSSRSKVCTYRSLRDYVDGFTFPKSAPDVSHLFTDSANANNAKKGSFSSSGSDFLTLVPVLHRFFERLVLPCGEHTEHVKRMLAVLCASIGDHAADICENLHCFSCTAASSHH